MKQTDTPLVLHLLERVVLIKLVFRLLRTLVQGEDTLQ